MKRIHEYKRQLLNVLGIIWRYDQLKRMTPEQREQVLYPHSSAFLRAAMGHQHITTARISARASVTFTQHTLVSPQLTNYLPNPECLL